MNFSEYLLKEAFEDQQQNNRQHADGDEPGETGKLNKFEGCSKVEGCCKEASDEEIEEAFCDNSGFESFLEANDVEFGDVEKIVPPDTEGFSAAVAAEDDFVQAPDVADGYNATEENLNNAVDSELEAAFGDNSGFEATGASHNFEDDQFSTVNDFENAEDKVTDKELAAESFTGWSDLD